MRENNSESPARPNNGATLRRRVLVIAYYFPPMGLSGVQRVAGFVKYLPHHGWLPTILTVEPAGYFAYDATLLDEIEAAGVSIYRTRSWDPTRFFGKTRIVSMPSESVRSSFARASQFLFVPDNKIGWIPHALREGNRILGLQKFDAVFSSAPPYSAHLVAARLSRRGQIPLVADFRDDWVGNPRHNYPTRWHRRWNERLERYVLDSCSHAVTINEPIRESLAQRKSDRASAPSISVIPHGYDPEIVAAKPIRRASRKMQFLYTGIFYDAQTPDYFLRALAQMIEAHPETRSEVEAVFVGLLPKSAQQLVTDLALNDIVRYDGYVPHAKAVAYQCAATVLWMTIGSRSGAEGISTGKLFEYMGSRKPILALVPSGAARDTLHSYGAATIVDPEDVDAIAQAMELLFRRWRAATLPAPVESYVEQLDRRRLAGLLAGHLDASINNGD